MVENKNSQKTQQRVTVRIGYGLFALIVIGLIFSTVIPWTQLLFSPHVKQLNVVVTFVGLVAGAILPALLAYFIGDRATHAKNKLIHHYNGILFGVLSYWLVLLFGVVGSEVISSVSGDGSSMTRFLIVILWPIIGTIVSVSILAIFYSKSNKNKSSVLSYPPYQVLLISLVTVVSVVAPIWREITVGDSSFSGLLTTIATTIVVAISYVVLKNTAGTRASRLTTSVVAVTILLIAMYALAQITPYVAETSAPVNYIFSSLALLCGLGMWVGYLLTLRRAG